MLILGKGMELIFIPEIMTKLSKLQKVLIYKFSNWFFSPFFLSLFSFLIPLFSLRIIFIDLERMTIKKNERHRERKRERESVTICKEIQRIKERKKFSLSSRLHLFLPFSLLYRILLYK